jgi:hypothetical protein
MNRNFIYILFLFLAISCQKSPDVVSNKPDWVLEEDLMSDIIVDLRIADAALYSSHTGKQRDKKKDWEYIMKKYQVSDSIFRKSHDYYAGHPDVAEKIYEKAIDKLSEMVAKNSVGQ